MKRRVGRRRISALWAMVVQACFVSWVAWLPALVLGPTRGYAPLRGVDLIEPSIAVPRGTGITVAVLYVLGSYGPLLAALSVSGRLGGPTGAQALVRRALQWRVSPRWYAIALGLPLLMIVPAVGTARMLGLAPVAPRWPPSVWRLVGVFLFHLLTLATAEFGWRGVALPLARRRHPAEQASYVVGAASALWALPYIVGLYQGQAGYGSLSLHIVGWTIYLLGASVIQTWLYNSTSSLWVCMLYAAWSMSTWTVATGVMGWQPLPQLVLGLVCWLVALALIRVYGGRTLVRA